MAWDASGVESYLKAFFDREYMRARDRFATEDGPRMQESAARRGLPVPTPEQTLKLERATGFKVAVPATAREIQRLVGEGKIPSTDEGRQFAYRVVDALKAADGEGQRVAAGAKADLRMFFDQAALLPVPKAPHPTDPYGEANAVDGLLPLLRREIFDRDLPKAIADATVRSPCALLFLDVDHFKRVNDEEGHPAGDKVLIEVAKRLRAVVGAKGRTYRYGGEEFAVVLENYSISEAATIADRIRISVADEPIAGKSITVSIGVALAPDHATTIEALVVEADGAMYAVKHNGRNAVRVAAGSQGEPIMNVDHEPGRRRPTEPAGPSLSDAARELLLEAARDQHGVVIQFRTMAGLSIKTNARNFVEGKDPRSEARWSGALQELRALGLLQARGNKGELWGLTQGYDLADRLSSESAAP